MKKKLILLCLTIAVFVVLTLLTASIQSPSDGDDTYGFPLTFLKQLGGIACDPAPCPPGTTIPIEISYWKLLVDLLFAAAIALLSRSIFIKLKSAIRNNRS